MVVLAVAIISKSGDPLISKQFVGMSRIKTEGLLAAFRKLVAPGKQPTYVETENVRYVYHPFDVLYLLLITDKQSNVLEDLHTLGLLSKLVPEYCPSLDEQGICEKPLELTFAFDEVLSLGPKENVSVAQVKQYCEMDSQAERLHKLVLQSEIDQTKDVLKHKVNEIDKSKIDHRIVSVHALDSLRLSAEMLFGHPSGAVGAPSKRTGMKLGKSQKANKLLESLKAEGELVVEDVRPSAYSSRAAAPPPTDPITLTIEEKLYVTLQRDIGVSNIDVQGTLSLQVVNQDDGFIQVQIESGDNREIKFKTHPKINKELFSNKNILASKDPNHPFPAGLLGDGLGVLKWRLQSKDESDVPLAINCWPSVFGNETYVSIEYEAASMFDLQNVAISVPLPALREAPSVRQIDGDWRYDSRNSVMEWSILLIDDSNRSGSMEFVVPIADTSAFFPISVRFSSISTFSNMKVVSIIPQKNGPAPKFSQRTQLVTHNYQVV